MSVTRRSVGGAGLYGLGSALAGLGELRIKRRAMAEQASAEHDQKMQDKLFQTYLDLSQKVAADPTQYATLQPVAQALGIPLAKPADAQMLKPLTAQINTAKSPLDLPSDVGAAAESMGVRPIPAADPMTGAGSQFADPSAPFASTADMNKPAVADLIQLADRRKQGIQSEDQRQVDLAGQKAKATGYGSASGTNEANNENFDSTLDQERQKGEQSILLELDKARRMVPIAAQQAGAVAGATARANLAPDIVTGEANKAGQIATAQQNAQNANKPVDDKTRQTVSFFVRAASSANNATGLEAKGVSPTGAAMPNAMRSTLGQQYNQAIDEFALAVLRKESGAAISPTEHAQFAATYFARPGDSPQTIAEKQLARQRVLEGLKFEANPGVPEFVMGGGRMPIVVKPGSTLDRLVPRPRP